MAYNIADRFPAPPKSYRIFEPGAYQNVDPYKVKANKVAFLSNTVRVTRPGNRIWTHALYHADIIPKIPPITSIKSKCPRFPYEALPEKESDPILCDCGINKICECLEEKVEDEKCQGKIHRKLYKGHAPRMAISKEVVTEKKKNLIDKKPSPPFYDTKVIESTAFYHGCKWSQWKSPLSTKPQEVRPGPAEYTLDRQPTAEQICAEKVRAYKRKHSKQLRFIEMIQRKNIIEQSPGPAEYNVQDVKSTDLTFIGPKAARFQDTSIVKHPGPADHWIKRDFDIAEPPDIPCHAKLPDPPFFGIKALRFKLRKEEGPGPASYSPNFKFCKVLHCNKSGFGTSAVRFKDDECYDSDDDYENGAESGQTEPSYAACPTPTWQFRSKVARFGLLKKYKIHKHHPDHAVAKKNKDRSAQLQYKSPFYSSEGRFQPWYDWMTVLGKLKTPGPGYYNIEKLKSQPAVCKNSFCRAQRFPAEKHKSPAPNEYHVNRAGETILGTHNQKLKKNIDIKHKFVWQPMITSKKFTLEEQESNLLQKSIALLEDEKDITLPETGEGNNKCKHTKLLRYFLYSHQTEMY